MCLTACVRVDADTLKGDATSATIPEPYHAFDTSAHFVDVDASQHAANSYNPYAQDPNAANGATIYGQQNAFTQPVLRPKPRICKGGADAP